MPGGTQVPSESQSVFAYGTITLCGRSFQKPSANHLVYNSHMLGPTTPPAQARAVWADPRSLATTSGISVDFFSSGYLDVSVPRVSFTIPMYSV